MRIGKWYLGFVVRRRESGWTAKFPDEFLFVGVGRPPLSVLEQARLDLPHSKSVARRLRRS